MTLIQIKKALGHLPDDYAEVNDEMFTTKAVVRGFRITASLDYWKQVLVMSGQTDPIESHVRGKFARKPTINSDAELYKTVTRKFKKNI